MFCVLCVFVVVVTPRLPIRTLLDLGVGWEVIYPFVHIVVKVFHFCIVFLFAFWELLCLCDWFLTFDSLVASSHIGRICMMEHLSTMWSPISHNNLISHVRFCAYIVHLIIDFLVLVVEIWVWGRSTWLIDFQF